jgi:hypothetical protein
MRTPETSGLDLRIVDRRSAIPITSVVVNVIGDSHLVTEQTDVRGSIAFDLPEGAYDVMIFAAGYTPTLLRGIGVLSGQRVELIRALSPGDERLEDPPAGAIGGTCLDRVDRPLANIIVLATAKGMSCTARTDKHGCYMLSSLPPDVYRVTWRAGDRALLTEEIEVERPGQLVRKDVRLLYA